MQQLMSTEFLESYWTIPLTVDASQLENKDTILDRFEGYFLSLVMLIMHNASISIAIYALVLCSHCYRFERTGASQIS